MTRPPAVPSTRAAEAARAAPGLFEVFGPGGLRRGDGFDDELRDARAGLYLERLKAVVDERAQNLAAVVGVDDARQHVYPLADGEPRARRDAAVEARGDGHREPRPDGRAPARLNRHALDRVEVEPRRARAPARRQFRFGVESLEV